MLQEHGVACLYEITVERSRRRAATVVVGSEEEMRFVATVDTRILESRKGVMEFG